MPETAILTGIPAAGTPQAEANVGQYALLLGVPAAGTPQAVAGVFAAGKIDKATLAVVLGSAGLPGTIQKTSLAVVLAAELPVTSRVYIGSTLISDIYLGSTPISTAYLGSTQVCG